MLSVHDITLIKATIPLLETGGEALTTHFYRILLEDYPEIRPLFNKTHQASGDQARALANGILMYARHIDRLEQLGGLVSTIVNKHVSLQILPEHYGPVGAALLRSIREVLGPDVATDDIIAAWGAAYGQLADILIGTEEKIYSAKEAATGGWRGGRRFRIDRKEQESTEITSFYFSPVDGGVIADFEPGQYIGLRLMIAGLEVRRNYSLSAHADGQHYRISVKREPNGQVSNFLHDHMHEGDTLELFPPAGDFTLQANDKPLVLISAGVGITPMISILTAALKTDRPIHFIHCARRSDVHAFRDWVDALAEEHPQLQRFYCYDAHHSATGKPDATGLLSRNTLAAWMPESRDVDAYFLGPKPFMANIKRYLKDLQVPETQIRYEFFGPASALD